MIIKGSARTGPQALGPYLQNADANERVDVVETRGTVAKDIVGALIEMDAYAEGSRCQKPLYHAQISPEPPFRLTPEQRNEAVDALEEKLGFTGHPRVVVIHEKKDREHIHVVWTRINSDTMKAVPISFNYVKNEEVSRDLERRFGHPRVQGAHAERDGAERPDRSPTRSELEQEEKTGVSRKAVKEDVTACFRSSDAADAFRAAVEDKGYLLAKGDRRDFVVVDQAGGIHSLAKMIDGMRAAQLREFMKSIDRKNLPSAATAQDHQLDKAAGRASVLDEHKWNDELAKNAIIKDRQHGLDERSEAERFRQAAIKWEAEQKSLRDRRREARAEANREKNYGRGDGYTSQSSAALKDHKRRQRGLNDAPRPLHPSSHRSPSAQNDFRDGSKSATRHAPEEQSKKLPNLHSDRSYGPAVEGPNYKEAADRRYKAMKITLYGEGGFEKSYFADEARLRGEEARERKRKAVELRGPLDRPLGTNDHRPNLNDVADRRYNAMQITLYGEGGYEKSYFADEARLRREEEQERKREKAKNAPTVKPLGEKQKGRSIWESDEEARSRAQRRLNEEKWEARSDNEELLPDRQKKAPGGGRTRSR